MSPLAARPFHVAVLAHAGVLNRSGYARRVVDSALSFRRALPDAAVTLATLETPRNLRRREDRRAVSATLAEAGVTLRILHAWPRRWGLARLSDRIAARAVARMVEREGIDALHAHGPDALALAFAAASGRDVRVVADVHGDRAAEAALESGSGDAPPAHPADVALTERADAVAYASEALVGRMPAGAGRPTAVVPCLVADRSIPDDRVAEERRAEARRRLGLAGEERVVAYAGSLAAWQEFPRLVRILAHAAERVPQLRLLVVTPDVEAAKAALAGAGLAPGRAAVTTATADGVVDALLLADAGVVLRRPALANRLAFPTKFAEYLAAGLCVVASDAVPAVADRMAKEPALGHVLSWEKDDATWAARIAGAAKDSGAAARAARRAYARAHLASSASDDAYRRLYTALRH